MRKLLIVAVAAGLLVGLVASPVSAAKPEVVFEDEFDDEYPWSDLDGNLINCKDGARADVGDGEPDFTVLHKISGKVEVKVFLTRGGEVARNVSSVGGTDYLINSVNNSKMITGMFHTKFVGYSAPDEEPGGIVTIVGPDWHMVAPGFGAVFVAAGRLVLDLSELPDDPFVSFSGRNDFGNFEYDAVCEALS